MIAFGFATLLFFPILDQCLDLSTGFKSTEKRILAPFPTFRFPHVKSYIHEFDEYYKENFGWRNALFHAYSYWKLVILGQSPLPDKVVVGKHGWFYPGNSLNHAVDKHRGLMPMSQSSMHAICQRLSHFQQQLAKHGTRLYILVAPDSYTIYPENLPDYIHENGPSNLDLFKQYLTQHTTVPFIDIRNALRMAKKNHVVYSQTDTHWNDYGSLIASLTVVDYVKKDFPQLIDANLSDYRVKATNGMGGDLVTMLALNKELKDSVVYRITPVPSLAARQIENTPNADMNLPSSRFIGQKSTLPKLLLIGDSFSFSMNQFIPNHFGESYLVRTNRFKMDLVQNEHPDIVVLEIVERNIDLLASY
ncbi:alginate O-acetyltransferase AlgX-related protein [Spirosoma endbachense]|uniref:AlgX/AlgJ SGNH hydrolase-like domain-containing protein n=1 Tax=Spirosoma endbachense TaxID=2666025 RepID=A0A6P1W1Y7_9BACT|nr:hypothetical protein [Spirosoma endbachense]QHV99055.1 hypothetical protein GJR95_30405 [Spirosoma endbachense]